MGTTDSSFFGLFVLILLFSPPSTSYEIRNYNLVMPNVSPKRMDTYFCTPVRVNYTREYYIVGFEPQASMDVAHHILLYGCGTPGSSKPVWNCGEMGSDDDGDQFNSPCQDDTQIIYAWARDAPELNLPEGVGFLVGGNSPIQYLVLQVHYLHVDKFLNGETDRSGIVLHYTERPLSKLAGVLLLGTSGFIPPLRTEYMETSCIIDEDKVLHPFAFRTHTHALGKVVSGYLVRNENGTDRWTLLGKKNPQEPQMFYPIENQVEIHKNDKVAARCTMVNPNDKRVQIGATSRDEMCNFYLMYWVDGGQPLSRKYCFTSGPPHYYWKIGTPALNNIPDHDASTY